MAAVLASRPGWAVLFETKDDRPNVVRDSIVRNCYRTKRHRVISGNTTRTWEREAFVDPCVGGPNTLVKLVMMAASFPHHDRGRGDSLFSSSREVVDRLTRQRRRHHAVAALL